MNSITKQLRRKWYALLLSDSRKPADERLVCSEWSDFARFMADVGSPDGPNKCLCMIDAEHGFRPGNVRWGTFQERLQGRRHCKVLSFQGKSMSASDWAKELGISRKTLYERLQRHSVETALSMPRRTPANRPHITFASHTMSLSDWARTIGISRKTLAERLARHSESAALSTPRLPRGGVVGRERPKRSVPYVRKDRTEERKTFQGTFEHEVAVRYSHDELLAIQWIEKHADDLETIEREFTSFFGSEVAARAVELCMSGAA